MEIYPAIDLMNGKVVRLYQGNPSDAIIYAHLGSPIETAQKWVDQGAEMLHIIDLDATLGRANNLSILQNIVDNVDIPIQFGGGLRDENKVTQLLDLGIQRVILGTMATCTPQLVVQIGESYGFDRLVVALDYTKNRIVIEGWRTIECFEPLELLTSFRNQGVSHFLMTAVENDGTMLGPDQSLSNVCGPTLSDIIVAGGVSTLEDIRTLSLKGFGAAVVGRSLYEGTISLPEALQSVRRFIT